MSSTVCGRCNKTVYPVEKVECGRAYHKGCFRCQNESCDISLTLKNVQVHEGKIYCGQHVPKHKLTSVADSLSTQHAMNAPKKTAEGLHKTQVGTGDAGSVGIDAMSNQHAINAPKKKAEGLAKQYVASEEATSRDSPVEEEQRESVEEEQQESVEEEQQESVEEEQQESIEE